MDAWLVCGSPDEIVAWKADHPDEADAVLALPFSSTHLELSLERTVVLPGWEPVKDIGFMREWVATDVIPRFPESEREAAQLTILG